MHLPDWKGVEGTAGWETSSSKENVKEQMREEGKSVAWPPGRVMSPWQRP